MKQRAVAAAALIATAALLGWLLFVGLPRWYARPAPGAVAGAPGDASAGTPAVADPARKIKARLFYVAEDGRSLDGIEQEVPFAETPTDQAKAIMAAQLATPPPPLLSALPAGTTLRALFVTDQGEAFVDLSRELAAAHPGGSMNELLTIYTVVNALAVNLPAITAVQVLIDGKEVDTLAGHVELRQPLVKNLAWVRAE
jgi:spore germination protein GerM